MSKNVDLDAKSRSSADAPPAAYQLSSRGELPGNPKPRVVPTTPEWPESPEQPERPKYPESPVPPVSVGHDDQKALKMLAGRNACQARNTARKRLWQLARDLTALEKKTNRELEIAEIIVACSEWYRLSQLFLDPARRTIFTLRRLSQLFERCACQQVKARRSRRHLRLSRSYHLCSCR
jgi:hypothetical protein